MATTAAPIYRCIAVKPASVPLVLSTVAAGFPSPAEDYLDRPLDFNELLIVHPSATFAVRVRGDSMTGAGILPNDIAIIDRSLTPTSGAIILAIVDGEFTLKFFRRRGGAVTLEAANPNYKTMPIMEGTQFECWGVLTGIARVI